MRNRILIICLLAICVTLAGCSQLPPEQAADGLAWDESWVTVGSVLGVDTPEGWTPRENNDALAANGMYYATWSAGEAVPYVNEDGEDAELYDAQVYVLLAGYDAAEKAGEAMEKWLAMAESQYAVTGTYTGDYNGQTFTVLTYTYDSESNPYARGASAFGVYRNYAVSVELSCRDGFAGDERELLEAFLQNCHYGA